MKLKLLLLNFTLTISIFGQTNNDDLKFDYDESVKFEKKLVKKFSRKTKIIPLENKKMGKGEAEIRVWIIFHRPDIYFVESFIIRKKDNQMTAFYIVGEKKSAKFTFTKTELNPPKNGWEKLNDYLLKNNLNFDFQLTPEKTGTIPDGERFAVETKTGDKYNFRYYEKRTENEDGKRVQNLCRELNKEFDLQKLYSKQSHIKRLMCEY